jgi:hypothetical protein
MFAFDLCSLAETLNREPRVFLKVRMRYLVSVGRVLGDQEADQLLVDNFAIAHNQKQTSCWSLATCLLLTYAAWRKL